MRALLFGLIFALPVQAMEALDDADLAGVSGRDGISLATANRGWSADSIRYGQDGQGVSLHGVSKRAADGGVSTSSSTLDVENGQLRVQHDSSPQVLAVSRVELDGGGAGFGAFRAFYTLGATLRLRGGGASGVSGIALDGSRLSLRDATFYYRDNGFDLIVKGLSFDAYLNQAYLDIVSGGDGDAVRLDLRDARFVGTLGGIGLDLAQGDPAGQPVTPGAPDSRGPNAGSSFGALELDVRLGGSLSVAGGGASGEGIRVRPDLRIDGGLLQYRDEGILRAENFSGTLRSLGGLTLDLAQDAVGGYAGLALQDLQLSARLGDLRIGGPSSPTLGALGVALNFADQGARRNLIKLRPGGGGNSGGTGLTADLGWNLADGSISLVDDGNSLWFSGLRSHGSGRLTVDLTRSCAAGAGAGCYAGTQSDSGKGSYDGHFDGLRLGLNRIEGGYRIDGLRVGSPTAPLQGGTGLLVLLEVFPAYDFILDGQLTLSPGGSRGDGLRYNTDLVFSDARAAIMVSQGDQGLWLSGMQYDMHFRDGSLDVSGDGLELRKGVYWSRLEVGDLRWGNSRSGASLGRLLVKRFEQGSLLTLGTGGAGALCVGGSGASPAACSASGGRWEDRGRQGLSVKLKSLYARDAVAEGSHNGVVTDEKRNQIIWETHRVDGVAGSGSQLVADNFYTSDGVPGDPDANTYGLRADFNLDVAPTRVCTWNNGQCLPATPDPLGFAVNGRVHFKEVNVERLQSVHPSGGATTAMYGIKVQNADINANLTATPLH